MRRLRLPPRSPALPTTAAAELEAEHRRTRRLRLGLAALAVALLAGCLAAAQGLVALPTTYFAHVSGGVVVLDLSTSVDAQKAQRVQRVLRSFAETEGRIGLVVFSDTAYEMFPPDTRSEELRPVLRFFAGVRRQSRTERLRRLRAGVVPGAEQNPWALSFRGGTRISTGLAEARRVLGREGNRDLSVLLLSDLDNSGFDTSALTEELVTYDRQGIDLRVIPLFPQADDRRLFEQIVGPHALVERAELVSNTGVRERQTLVGAFPWPLVAAAAALLALLALGERLLGRLAWRAA